MIKAIVFDCFGVLATDGWLPFKRINFSKNPELFNRATELNREVDRGIISYDQFVKKIAQMAQVSEKLAHEQIDNNIPDQQLFKYIKKELKPHYKIGVLSNAAANWLGEIFTKEQNALFDAIALSYEVGAIKPEPKAYETIAKRLGVKTAECIFVDDQQRYCLGAEKVGMKSIGYAEFAPFKERLKQLLKD